MLGKPRKSPAEAAAAARKKEASEPAGEPRKPARETSPVRAGAPAPTRRPGEAASAPAGAGEKAAARKASQLPPRAALPPRPPALGSLSEEGAGEEVTRTLTSSNPHADANVVHYHHRERVFRLDPMVEHLAMHWSRDGHKVHRDSPAAQEQAAREAARCAREAEEAARLRDETGEGGGGAAAGGWGAEEEGLDEGEATEPIAEAVGEGETPPQADASTDAASGPGEEAAAAPADRPASAEQRRPSTASAGEPQAPGSPAAQPPAPARFRNQFVFKERAMQTTNLASRDKGVATEPAPKMTFGGTCSRAQMYEWYLEDVRQQEKQRQLRETLAKRAREGSAGTGGGGGGGGEGGDGADDAGQSSALTCSGSSSGSAVDAAGGCSSPPAASSAEAFMSGVAFQRSARLLERLVCQNSFREIADDFKYWEDGADALKPGGQGSLLPLWTFSCERARRRAVTCLAWHPQYDDLFAVGYGSFDFQRPLSGLVALFSLKCPSQPELILDSHDSGITALAFHPHHSQLLAVGMHDGGVAVYDVRPCARKQPPHGAAGGAGVHAPLFAANARKGKHDDPVWQVAWAAEEGAGGAAAAAAAAADAPSARAPLCFYSVSGDGRVCLWTMTKSELSVTPILELRACAAAPSPASSPSPPQLAEEALCDEALLAGRVGGTCFDFSPLAGEGVYLVGTEEGGIHRCSTAYSSRYLASYRGHSMAVYALRWSPFSGTTFLSASADWSVRLWDARPPAPGAAAAAAAGGAAAPGDGAACVMSFDLGAAAGDVAWAPHCSSSFAACGADGRVHFYNLSLSKTESLCSQKVVKNARLTKVAFNATHPIMLVGDDKGGVTCLKLSPNLRRVGAAPSAVLAAATQHHQHHHAASAPAPSFGISGGVGGGGGGAAEGEAGGEGAGAGEAEKQRGRLQAIIELALKGAVGSICDVPLQPESWSS